MAKALDTISPIEFARRFARGVRNQDQRYTWFIGAGCSVSSGIRAAGGLVEKWLNELQELQGAAKADFDRWRQTAFSGFDVNHPARHYAQVFRRCYPSEDEQQREIERICADGEPSYGYATFAQILSQPNIGERCNTVLTTNFDDLLADALYMYGERRMRPQIITHEALARYVRIASHRPTIVKLHGDAHLDPKNMEDDTARLGEEISRRIQPFVQGSALVFVGYGGNDESIHRFFAECPLPTLRQPIYWVGRHDPAPTFRDWLQERRALRVDHTDFDKLMHHLRGALAIPHPEATRWDQNFKRYLEQYKSFEDELKAEPESPEKSALQQTSQDASKSLPTDWDYYIRARKVGRPDEAEKIYREGIRANPNSYVLLGGFAVFLQVTREDMDGAEDFYKRSIDADPKNAITLGNYASFLKTIRKDMDGAEAFYKRAITADPKRAENLGNYAQLLFNLGRDVEGLARLRESESLAEHEGLKTELKLYALIYDPAAPPSILSELKVLLVGGGRSPRWDFSPDLAAAERKGRSDLPLLRDLADVISDKQPIAVLDKHEAWLKA